MNMTLEQVRDWHRFQWSLNEARGTPWDGKEHEEMADAIEAHISRQSDGVSDEVVEIMRAVLTAFRHTAPPAERVRVPDGWERHQIAAGDCPPQSMVILVSSIRRMLSAAPEAGYET